MALYGFRKAERLVLEKDIEHLFGGGDATSAVAYPIRIVYRFVAEETERSRVLISVSKRRLRHAVDRNRAKRQMREAYRLEKNTLLSFLEQKGRHVHIALIWMADHPQRSERIRGCVARLLHDIVEKG